MVVASKPMNDAALNSSAMASEPEVSELQVNGVRVSEVVPPEPPWTAIATSSTTTTRNSARTRMDSTLTDRSTWRKPSTAITAMARNDMTHQGTSQPNWSERKPAAAEPNSPYRPICMA